MATRQDIPIREIIESAMDAVICVDESQTIFLFNTAAEKIFGHPRKAVVGQNLSILIPERFRTDHEQHIRNFSKGLVSNRRMDGVGKICGLAADGREIPLEASISQADSAEGKVFTVILRDISERIKAEKIISERLQLESTLSKMASSTPGVFIVYRRFSPDTGEFVYLSPNISEIFGPQAANLKFGSAEWMNMIHPEDRDKVRRTGAEAYAAGVTPPAQEYRVLHPTRGEIWVESRRRAERLPDGTVTLYVYLSEITERKKQEIAVRDSERQLFEKEKKLREVIRISGTGSFELDTTDYTLSGSDQWCKILGIPAGARISRADFFQIVHPDDRQKMMNFSDDNIRNLKAASIDFRLSLPEGETRWVIVTAEARKAEEGKILYDGTIIDVTAVRQSEERFREVVENIQEVFWVTDTAKNKVVYVSPIYEKIWGRTVASLYESPRTWLEAIHPEDRGRIMEASLRQAEGKYNEEYRIIRADSTIRWVSDRAFPIHAADGKIYRIAGVAQDITERKKLEQELSRFVDLSPAVLYALRVDKEGFVPTWRSDNLNTLTGYNIAESGEATWWAENIHPEDRQRILDAHTLPYEIDQQVLEYRFKKKNGSYIWIRDEKRLIRNTRGDPSEIIGSWSDITERVQLEAQMRQSQKMEAIGQLAAGVAHDFNNLLTVIVGNAALIAGTDRVPPDIAEWAQDIVHASEKAAYLTKQLLLVGRRQSLELKSLDLNDTVRNMLTMLRRLLGADVETRANLCLATLGVYADSGMIDQVLLNLAVNARDAMPEGGIFSIESETCELDETTARSIPFARPGAYARISVSDTGSGISKEILPKIFEPFFTTKGVSKGTGLGLATVFGIVQQHQGWINVYSEPGLGTTFKIYLPLLQGQVTGSERKNIHNEISKGSETILVVEDQIALRKLATTILTRLGYHVLEAATGREALTVWESHRDRISLILTDVIMPDGMSGLDLAKQLRKRKADLKIIFTSGYTPDLMKKEVPLKEGVDFLAKPYAIADLARIVRATLDDSGRPDNTHAAP